MKQTTQQQQQQQQQLNRNIVTRRHIIQAIATRTVECPDSSWTSMGPGLGLIRYAESSLTLTLEPRSIQELTRGPPKTQYLGSHHLKMRLNFFQKKEKENETKLIRKRETKGKMRKERDYLWVRHKSL